jgi:predicted DNA-binding transcriptional regulator AlpA
MKRRIQEQIDQKLAREPLNGLEMLKSGEVSRYLRLTRWTLLVWRRKRQGPPFVKLGRNIVRYPRWRLEQFVQKHLCEGSK